MLCNVCHMLFKKNSFMLYNILLCVVQYFVICCVIYFRMLCIKQHFFCTRYGCIGRSSMSKYVVYPYITLNSSLVQQMNCHVFCRRRGSFATSSSMSQCYACSSFLSRHFRFSFDFFFRNRRRQVMRK